MRIYSLRSFVCRDQKATDADEIARIAKAGGYVNNGRVMGILAVARAFGDASLKTGTVTKAVTAGTFRNKLQNCGYQVEYFFPALSEPEITTFRPFASDEFIIMATDGLWDVFSSQDAVSYVFAKLLETGIGEY